MHITALSKFAESANTGKVMRIFLKSTQETGLCQKLPSFGGDAQRMREEEEEEEERSDTSMILGKQRTKGNEQPFSKMDT